MTTTTEVKKPKWYDTNFETNVNREFFINCASKKEVDILLAYIAYNGFPMTYIEGRLKSFNLDNSNTYPIAINISDPFVSFTRDLSSEIIIPQKEFFSIFEFNTSSLFYKEDLKEGMILKFKDNSIGMICKCNNELFILFKDSFETLDALSETLKHANPLLDVIEIREAKHPYHYIHYESAPIIKAHVEKEAKEAKEVKKDSK